MKLRAIIWVVLIGTVALAGTLGVGAYYGGYFPRTDAKLVADPRDPENPKLTPEALEKLFPPISKTGPYPAAVLEGGPNYEFGVMGVGEKREHVFVIGNNGEAPLIIWQGDTTCKCTMTDFGGKSTETEATTKTAGGGSEHGAVKSKDGKPAEIIVQPKDTAKIKLSWHGEFATSPFVQSATVLTNDPQNKVIRVYIRGDVYENVSVVPAEAWNLGEIHEHKPAEAAGVIISKMLDSFKILDIKPSSKSLSTEIKALPAADLKQRSFKSGYALKVSISPDVPVGPLKETVSFTTEDPGGKHTYEIPVLGFRTGPFRILSAGGIAWDPEHSLVNIPQFPSSEGRKVSLPFFVKDLAEKIQFEVAESDISGLKAHLDPSEEPGGEGRQRYQLVIEIPPSQPANYAKAPFAVVKVKTNHPDAREFKLFLRFISL